MKTSPILLFDGVCNLCAGAIQFVLNHEKKGSSLTFASLQSEAGKMVLRDHGLPENYFNSLVYVQNGKVYTQSDGAFQIAKHLKAPYRWLSIFKFLPKGFRDFCYQYIGNHRYKWFGKKEECWLPTPELEARFL